MNKIIQRFIARVKEIVNISSKLTSKDFKIWVFVTNALAKPIKKSTKASAWLADLDRFFQLRKTKNYTLN